MKSRYYIGFNSGQNLWDIFKFAGHPTEQTHGQYNGVIGPFRTKRGAEFMLRYGRNNPHCQTVSRAEKLAKRYGGKK